MENGERKIGRILGERKLWSSGVFSLGFPFLFLPELGRRWGRERGLEEILLSICLLLLLLLLLLLIYIFLCNKNMRVNLYKIHFLSSHFSSYPNKRVFHPSIFLPLTKHKWGKIKYFLSPTFPPLINQSLLYGNIFSSFCWKCVKVYLYFEKVKKSTTKK